MGSRRSVQLCVLGLLAAGLLRGDEPPAVYEVSFELTGNEGVSSTRLREALSALRADLRRSGVDQGAAEDAAYELVRHYRSLGYLHADVSGSSTREGNRFTVRFQIVEGPRSILLELKFSGNSFFGTQELEECFPWVRSGLLGLGQSVFTHGVLEEGVDCVVTRYQLEGYFYVAAVPDVSEDEAGGVRLRIDIQEGPRIQLASAPAFTGISAFPEARLLGMFNLEPRPMYTPRLGLVLKSKLIEFYKSHGYLFVEVEEEKRVDREGREAALTFNVKEGPLVHIEGVRISGNEKTYDWVLRNRLWLEAGDVYDEELVRKSYRSLLRSGLFSSVSIEAKRVEGSEDRVYLDVGVVEKARYKLTLLGGYGTYELLRGGVVLADTNLFGTGHRLQLEGRGSFRGESAALSYLNPFFFSEDFSHLVEGSYERRENPSFEQREYGGTSGVSWKMSDQLRSSLTYKLKQSNVLDADSGVPPELIQNVLISSIAASSVYDARNSIVDPERGLTSRATTEYAGGPIGSEIDFVKVSLFLSYIVPLPYGLRLVAAGRAGVIGKLADTDEIPLQERFFNGGESTIRSFPQDEAGPKSGGDPIGGQAYTTMNFELRCPLPFVDGLNCVVFFDTGTLTEQVEDFGGGRYFFGVGPGIRYNTPVGPFRFDVGFNPDRESGEDLAVFNFGVGYPF